MRKSTNKYGIQLKFKPLIHLVFLFTLLSCSQKPNLYLFKNPNYLQALPENEKLNFQIKKYFYRNFYNIHEIDLANYNSFPNEFEKFKFTNPEGILYLEDFLSPFIIKNTTYPEETQLKLLTFNLPDDELVNDPPLPIFNIKYDIKHIESKIINYLKNKSKLQDLSDCGILINIDYNECNTFKARLIKDFPQIKTLESISYNPGQIDDWLSTNEFKVLVFYGFDVNRYITAKNNLFTNYNIVEVMTQFGEIEKNIHYLINVDRNKLFNYGLHSSEFEQFVNLPYNEKKIIHCKIKYNVLIEKEFFPVIKKQNEEMEKNRNPDNNETEN